MYCQFCGTEVGDAKFCTNCGAPMDKENVQAKTVTEEVHETNAQSASVFNPVILDNVYKKIENSYTLWLVIAIAQIVIGTVTICAGYGLFTLGLGIWNIVNASTCKKNLDFFKTNPENIVPYYDSRQSSLIVMLVLNLLLGALFGCVAMIYDLSLRTYIMDHRHELP